MLVKLTGLKYSEIDTAEELNNHSLMQMKEVNHPVKKGKVAYRLEWGGKHIAWLPELESVRNYYREATTKQERASIEEWGKNLKQVLIDAGADQYNTGRIWMVKVGKIKRNSMGNITELHMLWERGKQ